MMTIRYKLRQTVRQRARYSCEYCGISEVDAGGELTVDHYQPQSKGGDDTPENLIYCCIHCNQFKRDYWATTSARVTLWNPRVDPPSLHFYELADGLWQPVTEIGAFTIQMLRLNRPALIANRLRQRQGNSNIQRIAQLRDLIHVYEQLLEQQANLVDEQHKLLDMQRKLILQLLLGSNEES